MVLTHVRPPAGALAIAALFGLLLAAACGGGSGNGDADEPTATRSDPNVPEFTLPNFSSVVVEDGFDAETVASVISLVERNEYKRRQAAPGLKITSKAFGVGRRMPIAQKFREGG